MPSNAELRSALSWATGRIAWQEMSESERKTLGQVEALITQPDTSPDVPELQRLFDMQWKRVMDATKLWQEAHPGNDLVWPDLGDLVAWLLSERAKGHALREAMGAKLAKDILTPWHGSLSSDVAEGFMRKCIDIACLGSSIIAESMTEDVEVTHAPGCAVAEYMRRIA